ncbi:MAG: class I poly(R)-hydroxyalkanoic acid synthase [Alphaproteobacteria bacterium]|nr:class I poly(R)-hydroxyalkanoic acid synthase [Alphaproteobacteria bacterium]MBM3732874.1 class I poly(R)-hydroxyalkanoic acid synthase [Acidimicrobiia bacterium]
MNENARTVEKRAAPESRADGATAPAPTLAERIAAVTRAALARAEEDAEFQIPHPAVVGKTFIALADALAQDPVRVASAQADLWRSCARLWRAYAARLADGPAAAVVEPAPDDRRFKDEAWSEDPSLDFLKQAYLLGARWLQGLPTLARDLDPAQRRKAEFYLRLIADALAPTNFPSTNPKVQRAIAAEKGANLVRGLDHFLGDLEKGEGRLRISMTDTAAFRLGENIAATPGKVMARNDLMELIQYEPLTADVAKRPLLIVPPWINKYYVLDLQPKNSFLRWTVEQGQAVFVISWVNPDASLAHKSFDDYLREGPLAAMDAIAKVTGEKDVNLVGYCIGGTLAASTAAWLAAKKDRRLASLTLLTTMLDFTDAGELAVFIDEDQLARLDAHMDRKGYLDGHQMARVFNLMRDNDLIWSFVINNYFLGREPPPFDLLYWNADSTRMPAMMHKFYLRKMYLENKLIEPGALTLAGIPLDLDRIQIPTYVLATREDHIAPWKSVYAATRVLGGPVRFALAASGHIAGVINPPAANKYGFWLNTQTPKTPEAWLAGATAHDGSWWTDWMRWLGEFANGRHPARIPGKDGLEALGPAPGDYVKTWA